MSGTQDVQAFALLNFAEVLLQPLVEQKLSNYPTPLPQSVLNTIRHSLLETFLWLDLGVRWRVFDKAEANHLFIHYFYPMFNDSKECFGTGSLFLPEHQQFLETVMRTKEFGVFSSEKQLENDAISLFQDCLESTADFLTNVQVQLLVGALAFEGETQWQSGFRSVPDSSDVVLAITKQEVSGASANAALIAGLLLSLEHMIEFDRLHGIFGDYHLLRQMYQIRTWSLNFRNEIVERRFIRLLEQSDQMLVEEETIQPPGISIRYKKGGLTGMGIKLVQDWKKRGSLYSAASGSK